MELTGDGLHVAPDSGQQGGTDSCGERQPDTTGSIAEVRGAAGCGDGVTDAQNGAWAVATGAVVGAAAGVEIQGTC